MYSGKPVHWLGRLPPPVVGSMGAILSHITTIFNPV
nr:MAG TPA: Porcine reproductive and respiratory syndrome virus 2b [Caudoviricetes sp.]